MKRILQIVSWISVFLLLAALVLRLLPGESTDWWALGLAFVVAVFSSYPPRTTNPKGQ